MDPNEHYLPLGSFLFVGLAILFCTPIPAATDTNSAAGKMILLDNLGRPVEVPTNQIPAGLLPPAKVGLQGQIPSRRKASANLRRSWRSPRPRRGSFAGSRRSPRR